jgi:hypothetical protein
LQECEALGVSPPAFPQLDEVSADLAATQASWGSYRDFLQERDSMAHKDWLSMRDQVRGLRLTERSVWPASRFRLPQVTTKDQVRGLGSFWLRCSIWSSRL